MIEKQGGIVHIFLMPTMEFQPATRKMVEQFLEQISEKINKHFGADYLPIRIGLFSEDGDVHERIEEHGLRWISSPP